MFRNKRVALGLVATAYRCESGVSEFEVGRCCWWWWLFKHPSSKLAEYVAKILRSVLPENRQTCMQAPPNVTNMMRCLPL